MKIAAYIIYLFLCGFVGVVCTTADIKFNDWRYWAMLASVIIAYLCGKCQ